MLTLFCTEHTGREAAECEQTASLRVLIFSQLTSHHDVHFVCISKEVARICVGIQRHAILHCENRTDTSLAAAGATGWSSKNKCYFGG